MNRYIPENPYNGAGLDRMGDSFRRNCDHVRYVLFCFLLLVSTAKGRAYSVMRSCCKLGERCIPPTVLPTGAVSKVLGSEMIDDCKSFSVLPSV